ncbi:MAG: hypothetical protein A2Z18_07170 [Armatimonadetes bacterium RBG_16_58_9]|nr:MAG: hypothetical protein A2Z18_07170 [Armatimonadetes bacterium RBG_16_58_9]
MSIDNAQTGDWISLAIGLFGLASAYLASKNRLPSWARKWLNRIGTEKISDAIDRAAAIAELTPDQRRKQAVIYLQKVCITELGFPVPASIANLLVEYVYQTWKRARRC